MDWSKAKNILIIALVAANLFIGAAYYETIRSAERDRLEAQKCAEEYVSELGVAIGFESGEYDKKLPVLFVSIAAGDAGENAPDGKKIVVTGGGGLCAVSPQAGDNRGSIISPTDGVLKLSCLLSRGVLDGLEISGAELVYLVDRAGLDQVGGRDTAVPAWEFTTNRGIFFIEALEQ